MMINWDQKETSGFALKSSCQTRQSMNFAILLTHMHSGQLPILQIIFAQPRSSSLSSLSMWKISSRLSYPLSLSLPPLILLLNHPLLLWLKSLFQVPFSGHQVTLHQQTLMSSSPEGHEHMNAAFVMSLLTQVSCEIMLQHSLINNL